MIINQIKKLIPAPIKARLKVGAYANKLKKRMLDLESENEMVSLVIGTPLHRNLGDHLITLAQFQYFEYLGYKLKVVEVPTEMYQMYRKRIRRLKRVNTVFINGGGWMGNLWVPEELLIQQMLKDFADKKIVILPQTVYFDEKSKPYDSLIASANKIFKQCNDVSLCVREKSSYNFSKQHYSNIKLILVPDIALSFYQWAPKNKHRIKRKIGVCMRNDRELFENKNRRKKIINWFTQNGYEIDYIDTMNESRVNIEDREQIVLKRLEVFSNYDFVITDRLHGMIFSYICGTPCVAFDNKTHKVSGVYNTWLSNSKRIFPVFLDKAEDDLKEFVTSDFDFTENVCSLKQFECLKEII